MIEATTSTSARLAPISASRATLSCVFLALGFLPTTWVVHIPRLKATLAWSDARLGLCLSAATLGLFLGMTLGGWIVERCRSHVVTGPAVAGLATASFLAITSTGWIQLAGALLLSGFSSGVLDIAANSQAAEFERRTGRAMMSSFHGFFSIGGLGGTLLGSALAGLSVAPAVHAALAAAPLALFAVIMHRLLIPDSAAGAKRFFISFPSRTLATTALVAFVFFLVEGSIFDWSGVFLSGQYGVDASRVGLGFAAFSSSMAATRMCGEAWIQRFGRTAVFVGGALIGAAGMILACLAPVFLLSIAGFALVGAGFGNCVPLLLSAAGRHGDEGAGRAIASVAVTGYLGLFVGPPVIGFVAHEVGLRNALLAALALLVATLTLTGRALRSEGPGDRRSA